MAAVDEQFTDATGRSRRASAHTVAWIRNRLGDDDGVGPIVLDEGDRWRFGSGTLRLETGDHVDIDNGPADELPLGYHRFSSEGTNRLVIVAPARCPSPRQREWGWSTQLYATRSTDSWGIGDLGDLRQLATWARRDCGAAFVLVNPLSANAPGADQQPSPYSPTSRRFLNPVYANVRDFASDPAVADTFSDVAARVLASSDSRIIDRDRSLGFKMQLLESVFAARPNRFDVTADPSLREFATWTAIAEQFGGDWRSWPAQYRHPSDPGVGDFARQNADRVSFHCWLQQLLRAQLADVCQQTRLVQDLPIGFDPGGMDAWAWQDLLALDASVGAPPDEFNTLGQNWSLPPFLPDQLRASGYAPFIETIRACLATNGALRIDHVMGLFRLWWIPEGASPAEGAFVRYPADDLLSIVALESHRANAVVIGEDLGTVEEDARSKLTDRNVLSYRLLWFEPDNPSEWTENALAAVSTHDLPTAAGLWDRSDIATQIELGLEPNVTATEEIRERLAAQGDLADDAPNDDAVRAAYALLAMAPSAMIVASLDDALAERERPNIPGADAVRPNWSLALPVALDDVESSPLTKDIARILDAAVNP